MRLPLDSPSVEFRIEAGHDLAACEAAVAIQREVWGDAVVVPSNMLLAAVHVGGYLGIARVDERVAGFVFSIYGVRDWRFTHHSHMLAVLPPYRGSEIARALKAAQRDHCLEQGLELVTWTMDPCESRNARFNLAKLGAFAAEYHEDFYGEMPDKLNVGLPSDRFLLEWPIATDRVARRLADQDAPPSLADAEKEVPYLLAADGDVPREPAPLADESHYLVAAPWDFQAVKRSDPALARRWREAHRRSLGAALGAGYAAVEYLIDPRQSAPSGPAGPPGAPDKGTRGAYLLVKRPPTVEARPNPGEGRS